jgi:hypothetical protein
MFGKLNIEGIRQDNKMIHDIHFYNNKKYLYIKYICWRENYENCDCGSFFSP